MAPSLAAWASTSSRETASVESGATRTGSTPVGANVEVGVTTLTVARTSSAPGLASTSVRSPGALGQAEQQVGGGRLGLRGQPVGRGAPDPSSS